MKTIFYLVIITASSLIVSCSTNECSGTEEDLKECYSKKSVNELANLYCDWAKKEREARENDEDSEKEEADLHTDVISSIKYDLSDDDREMFRNLTEGCDD